MGWKLRSSFVKTTPELFVPTIPRPSVTHLLRCLTGARHVVNIGSTVWVLYQPGAPWLLLLSNLTNLCCLIPHCFPHSTAVSFIEKATVWWKARTWIFVHVTVRLSPSTRVLLKDQELLIWPKTSSYYLILPKSLLLPPQEPEIVPDPRQIQSILI